MGISFRERISNYRKSIGHMLYDANIRHFTRNNERHRDTRKHIIISGFYRGGTTWLAEILSKVTSYPIIWEPLHYKISPEISTLGIDWKFSVSPDENAGEVKEYLDNILQGKLLSRPLLRVSNLKELKESDSLIFKFCRLNMSLAWFLKNYPENKVVYLVRNPYAVVASQLEHPAWDDVFNDSFPYPKGKYTAAISQHRDYLAALSTKAERLAADWSLDVKCIIENNLLENKERVLVIFYEDLLAKPEQVIRQILAHYGLDKNLSKSDIFSTKSRTSLANESSIEPLVQINKWRSSLQQDDIEKVYLVTKYFGVEKLYEMSDRPLFNLQL